MATPEQLKQKIFENLSRLTDIEEERQRKLDEFSSIDLVFLLDCTGSMSHWLGEVKGKLLQIKQDVGDILRPAEPFVGFVGYKDVNDADRFTVINLTQEGWQVVDRINNLQATGGGDLPEDVLGGMWECTKLNWESRTRLILHLFDAPPHGNDYKDPIQNYEDQFPNGVPGGVSIEDIFLEFKQKRIEYHAIPLTTYVNTFMAKMRSVHMTVFNKALVEFSVKNDREDFVKLVLRSVQVSLTGENTVYADVPLLDLPKTLTPDDITKFPERKEIKVNIYSEQGREPPANQRNVDAILVTKPFGSGSMRWSYLLKLKNENKLYVVKQWKTKGRGGAYKRCWEQFYCHQETIATLKEMNKRLAGKPGFLPVTCLDLRVLHDFASGADVYYTMENFLPGKYLKHNNNYTFINLDTARTNPIFQTIPHFSYVHCEGKRMVTDIQGVDNTLTDPAVHCADEAKGFGPADLGRPGMKGFFLKHVCNDFCKQLQLPVAPKFAKEVKLRHEDQ